MNKIIFLVHVIPMGKTNSPVLDFEASATWVEPIVATLSGTVAFKPGHRIENLYSIEGMLGSV